MCGRFTLATPLDVLERRFHVRSTDEMFSPQFNVSPGRLIPAVTDDHPDELSFVRWGLVPFWAKDTKVSRGLINARAESIAEKPTFRASFRSRRCLLLADGFYEWQKTPEGSLPYYIRLKSREPFAFAGLWSVWKGDEQTEERKTCAIITTEANESLKKVHNRMPAILSKDIERTWIDPKALPEDLLSLLVPYADKELEVYRVSKEVNRTRNNNPALVKRVG